MLTADIDIDVALTVFSLKVIDSEKLEDVGLYFDTSYLNIVVGVSAQVNSFSVTVVIHVSHLVYSLKLGHSRDEKSIMQHLLASRTAWL